MWSALLQPGVGLLDGRARDVRLVAQELAHHVVHSRNGAVLWCDGDHGFNPYDFAELNLVRGFAADDGAERVLVKRCMTPFQWDTVLTKHLEEKLAQAPAALVLALPYDRLFSTDELKPWEQVDYVRYSLAHLRELSKRHEIPILLGADLLPWRAKHPPLARLATRGVDRRWTIGRHPGIEGLVAPTSDAADSGEARQSRLLDFAAPSPIVAAPQG